MSSYRFPWQTIFWLYLVSSLGFALVALFSTGPVVVRIVFGVGAVLGVALSIGAWRNWHGE